jgi:hypothetical protein
MMSDAERVYTTSTAGVTRRKITEVAQEHPMVIRKPRVKKGTPPVKHPRKLDYHIEPPDEVKQAIKKIMREGPYTKVEYNADDHTWIVR